MHQWADLAALHPPTPTLSAAAAAAGSDAGADPVDAFRARLIFAYLSSRPSGSGQAGDSDSNIAAWCETLSRTRRDDGDDGGGDPATQMVGMQMQFDMHAQLAAQKTPMRSLLIVSGESWLFGKKVEREDDFAVAKTELSGWVGSSGAYGALWHATRLLRLVFCNGDAEHQDGDRDRDLKMVHEQWCIYIAALICWACAFDGGEVEASPLTPTSASTSTTVAASPIGDLPRPSPAEEEQEEEEEEDAEADDDPTPTATTPYPPSPSPIDAPPSPLSAPAASTALRHFLHATDTNDTSRLPAALAGVRAGTVRGLLEAVRTRKMTGLLLGGLLNEAEGVLRRLVEEEGRIRGRGRGGG